MAYRNMAFHQIFFAVVNERKRLPLDAFDRCLEQRPADAAIILPYRDLMQRCWDEAPQRPPFCHIVQELKRLKNILADRAAEQ
jgi:hypothetical protein